QTYGVAEYSGVVSASDPLDGTSSNTGNASLNVTTGSINVTQANDLVLMAGSVDVGGNIQFFGQNVSAIYSAMSSAFESGFLAMATSSSALNAAANYSTSASAANWSAVGASFKTVQSGGGATSFAIEEEGLIFQTVETW